MGNPYLGRILQSAWAERGDHIIGTKLDLEDDLGIDNEYYPVGKIFTAVGNHHLSFSFYRADYEGDKTLTTDINFGGDTFSAGDRIKIG